MEARRQYTVFSLCHVRPRDWTQMVRYGNKSYISTLRQGLVFAATTCVRLTDLQASRDSSVSASVTPVLLRLPVHTATPPQLAFLCGFGIELRSSLQNKLFYSLSISLALGLVSRSSIVNNLEDSDVRKWLFLLQLTKLYQMAFCTNHDLLYCRLLFRISSPTSTKKPCSEKNRIPGKFSPKLDVIQM